MSTRETEKSEATKDDGAVRAMVREAYGRVAKNGGASAGAGCCDVGCCGGTATTPSADAIAANIGYAQEQIKAVPEGANLGLGCGNPTAIAALRPGEVVLDLGAGAGFDALLAAQAVGPTGRVIGVDMTPEMLGRARENAVKAGLAGRVEFREGIIEELPVVSRSVDVVISNCVVNLSPDKARAFREAFRVLRPGGRLAISDIVLAEPLPPAVASLAEAWVGCVAGAMLEADYLGLIEAAGFTDVRVSSTDASALLVGFDDDPRMKAARSLLGADALERAAKSILSLRVEATKPAEPAA
ncbi:MAG: arsenite methyltransferase [Myxococcales bacterium]|nr:arsenite methyltransferase [Myxococcales bacterium]